MQFRRDESSRPAEQENATPLPVGDGVPDVPLSFRAERPKGLASRRSGVEEAFPSPLAEEKSPSLAPLARDDSEGVGLPDFPALLDALRRDKSPATVLLSGALTEAQSRALLQSGAVREGLRILVGDGSRLLLRRETFDALRARGADFAVLRGTRLAAVTVNPVSAGGWRFDAAAFLDAMRAALDVPVVDVMSN